MLEALIPYFEAPEYTLVDDLPLIGPLKLQLFGPLVATGVIIGWYRCLKYARDKDMDEFLVRDYLFWLLVAAFTISHWVSVIFYFPHQIEEDPLVLIQIWNGLSSVGGFFGAFVGMMLYLRWYCARQKDIGPQPIMPYADMTIFGLLIGWCFGRMGCSIVHDHPGKIVPEGTFMAVGPWDPRPNRPEIWRYDLGLVELIFALTLMVTVYFVLNYKKWPPGRLTGLVATTYAPFRFVIDSLRADTDDPIVTTPDARYMGLTPAQWFTIAFFVVGLWLLFFRKPKPSDFDYAKNSDRIAREKEEAEKAEAEAEAADDDDDDDDDDEPAGEPDEKAAAAGDDDDDDDEPEPASDDDEPEASGGDDDEPEPAGDEPDEKAARSD